MSLLYGDDFASKTTYPSRYTFVRLFESSKVVNAKNLILPATTMATSCYSSMFIGCTNLTTAPSVLPATTLASNCYSAMFQNCTSLTTAPELPATTLTSNCYQKMFVGCTSITSIKCLATDISASECTSGWVNGVAASGTFTKASSMSSWTRNVNGIPSGWSVVDV
jgi:hypothetical protein